MRSSVFTRRIEFCIAVVIPEDCAAKGSAFLQVVVVVVVVIVSEAEVAISKECGFAYFIGPLSFSVPFPVSTKLSLLSTFRVYVAF